MTIQKNVGGSFDVTQPMRQGNLLLGRFFESAVPLLVELNVVPDRGMIGMGGIGGRGGIGGDGRDGRGVHRVDTLHAYIAPPPHILHPH